MLLVLRWRKRRTRDKVRATQHDNDVRLQKSGPDGVGTAFQDKNGSGKSRESSRLSQEGASKRYLPDCMIISSLDQRYHGHYYLLRIFSAITGSDLADRLIALLRISACIQRRRP